MARRVVAGLLGVGLPERDAPAIGLESERPKVSGTAKATTGDAAVDAQNSTSTARQEALTWRNAPEDSDVGLPPTRPHRWWGGGHLEDVRSTPSSTGHDSQTRYLSAAAHLDRVYADAAIREFVAEPTRPLPLSPSVAPESVLEEALAARMRRKLRDGTLALLMITFVALSWRSWLLYTWIGVGLVVALPSLVRAASGTVRFGIRVAASYAALAVAAFLMFRFLGSDLRVLYSGLGDIRTALSLIPLVLMLVILVSDRVVVWNLLARRFGPRAKFLPPSDPFSVNRLLLAVRPARFRTDLSRYRNSPPEPAGSTPIIVYRGFNPFVGAGVHHSAWSMALLLDQDTEPAHASHDILTTELLYDRIREALGTLQNSGAIAPGQRLRNLRVTDGVYVSSAGLIDHLDAPASSQFLPDVDQQPRMRLTAAEAARLRLQPQEWARYYLCIEVDTWDRDLVLTSFVHVAVDDNTLYMEWTSCVLPPIRDAYRTVDTMAPSFVGPAWQGITRWLKLPVTIMGRTAYTMTPIRSLPRHRGLINPEAYGNLQTLREMAAATGVSDYFQQVDIERYEKILYSRLVPAISKTLRDYGHSPAQFERQAEQFTNSTRLRRPRQSQVDHTVTTPRLTGVYPMIGVSGVFDQ
ncbi:hypothetical protein AB0L41_42625 [Amycolatopsis mediterranei]|uniref:hypothetical protein n=1 Tax=Amycolatopsis mediterranei TaxID=33910 RepID=UPI00341E17BA